MVFINKLKGNKVVFSDKAKKELNNIPKHISKAIEERFNDLIQGKQNLDVKKLKSGDLPPLYRLRCGDYKAIYRIIEKEIVIFVIKVGTRQSVYDN